MYWLPILLQIQSRYFCFSIRLKIQLDRLIIICLDYQTSISATKMLEKLLEERLIVATNAILKNRDRLSNEFLKEKIDELNVDEIYWYNSNGEIIYTGREYLGWQATEGHPVYDFMKSNKDMLIEDTRKDSESDKYYKYAYAKMGDGEFTQIGILADNIYELTSRFCPQYFIDELVKKDDIVQPFFG